MLGQPSRQILRRADVVPAICAAQYINPGHVSQDHIQIPPSRTGTLDQTRKPSSLLCPPGQKRRKVTINRAARKGYFDTDCGFYNCGLRLADLPSSQGWRSPALTGG
jgi:hypothetical protein